MQEALTAAYWLVGFVLVLRVWRRLEGGLSIADVVFCMGAALFWPLFALAALVISASRAGGWFLKKRW